MKSSKKFAPALIALAVGLGISSAHAADGSDRLIVKYKDGVNLTEKSQQGAMTRLSAKAAEKMNHKRFMHNNAQVIRLERKKSRQELKALMAQIAQDSDVEYVEIDEMMYPTATANDQYYSLQWHYHDPIAGINVESAWDNATGAGVTVAVLDTGYRPHADLVGNIVGGYDMINDSAVGNDGNGRDSNAQDPGDWVSFNECGGFNPAQDSSWHGTHVAGTIAAVTNNGTGVAGVAYNAEIVPVRVLGKCGGYTSDIADGIVWASGGSVSGVPANPNPAQVLNLSLGGTGSCSNTSQNAINTARANGAVVVVAAGNSNANVSGHNPGNCNGVISVAATNKQADRASYSNYGSLIDIAAPGGEGGSEGVASTLNTGTTTPGSDTYVYYAGTSMAAPHVAAVAALMFEANPNLTPDEVEQAIKDSARAFPNGSSCSTSNCGDGMLDAAAAVAAVSSVNPPANVAPTAAFTYNCNELACSFDGSGSSDSDGTISNYAWSFGGSGMNANHTFGSAGTYSVTLTVTDNDGASDTQTHSVTVTEDVVEPPADINLSFDGTTRKGFLKVRWNGASGNKVDIYRNGSRVARTRNDGKWNDKNVSSGSTYTYQVCEQGSSTCSDAETVSI